MTAENNKEMKERNTEKSDSTIEQQAIAIQKHADNLPSPIPNEQKKLNYLDVIEAEFFKVLKIFFITLLFLAIVFGFGKMYTQQGIVVVPFEISNNENLNSIAFADQLTAELMRIQQIHKINFKEISLKANETYFTPELSTEKSLGSHEMIVPKSEIVEFMMADIGTIDVGSGSFPIGKIVIAFKSIFPGSKPVTIIRGSLQRYGSNVTAVALLEGRNAQSWMIRQPINKSDDENLHQLIENLAFMIAHDLPTSNVSSKTWEGLKYYTEALDAYSHYEISGNPDDLSQAGNYSLEAISSESGYKKPYELLKLLELIYINIGLQKEAIEYCNKTTKLRPKSAHSWVNKGYVLQYLGKYDEAIQAYNNATKIDPKCEDAWNSKGNAFYNLGKYDQALLAYNNATEIDPKYEDAWNNKGNALRNLGKYDQALRAYNNATEIDPQDATPWNGKGNVYYDIREYYQALLAYNTSIELDPTYATPWNGKGNVFNDSGKYDQALLAYNKSIELDPTYATAWLNKGNVFNDSGKYDQALLAYNKSIELSTIKLSRLQ